MSRNIAHFEFAGNKLVYSAALVLAFGLFSYGAFGYKKTADLGTELAVVIPSPAVEANSTINTEDLLEGGSTIASGNISEEGVLIDFAFLDKKGFIIISQKQNVDISSLLAVSQLLPKGENKNITLNFTQKPEGAVLFAILYEDNGDGSFSLEDTLVKDEEGNPILAKLELQ